MKPKEVAERRLSLLSLGSLLYYARSSQSFFNELQSCFSLPFLRGRKAPWKGERSNLHLGVISFFSFTSEVCSLPLATYLSSSGHKKWTTENVPLNGMLLQKLSPTHFPTLGRQRRDWKVLVTFVWFIHSFMYKHGGSNILQTPLLDDRGSQLAHTHFLTSESFWSLGCSGGMDKEEQARNSGNKGDGGGRSRMASWRK